MKVLLVGDTHCSRTSIVQAFNVATALSCDKIFQLGDYGFWPKEKSGQKFLELTNQLIIEREIPLTFLAGNHEDWNDLDYIFTTYQVDEDGFYKYENIRIAPRTHVWTWDNINLAVFSGAYSIDKDFRLEGWDWFPQELPTKEDVAEIIEKYHESKLDHIDLLLAHDAPENLFVVQGMSERVIKVPSSLLSQARCAEALIALQPKAYVHGHWHWWLEYWYDHTKCIALNEMTTTDPLDHSFALLDTEKRTLESIYMYEGSIAFNTLFEF